MNIDDIRYIAVAKNEITKSHSLRSEIFSQAFYHACEWYGNLTLEKIHNSNKKSLYREVHAYIYDRVDKPVGFVSSFIWWWVAKTVIGWIVRKIIEHIVRNYWKQR